MTSRVREYSAIVAALLIITFIFTAGCTVPNVPGSPSAPTKTFQPGQILQSIGEVTGQGLIPQGVPRVVINTVTFTIGLTPGSKSVDLDNLTIIYADAVKTQTLTPIEGLRGEPPKNAWGILSVAHEAGQPSDRLEFDEQATIRINPLAAIVPGQLITIVVKPKEGQPLIIRRIIPTTINQGENVLQA